MPQYFEIKLSKERTHWEGHRCCFTFIFSSLHYVHFVVHREMHWPLHVCEIFSHLISMNTSKCIPFIEHVYWWATLGLFSPQLPLFTPDHRWHRAQVPFTLLQDRHLHPWDRCSWTLCEERPPLRLRSWTTRPSPTSLWYQVTYFPLYVFLAKRLSI